MTDLEKRYLELQLRQYLRKLARNQEQVPREKLKTVYKKAYGELLEQIRQMAERYLKEEIFDGLGGWFVKAEHVETVTKLVQK